MNVQVREFAAASSVQHVLHRDYEPRGVLQLQKVGVWKYAADKLHRSAVLRILGTTMLFAELPAARGGHVGADADLQPVTPLSMEHSHE
jgi:hypothetical protein